MAKKTKKMNQKYLIIAFALGLALAGYYGYRQMMTAADINVISTGDDGSVHAVIERRRVPPVRNRQ